MGKSMVLQETKNKMMSKPVGKVATFKKYICISFRERSPLYSSQKRQGMYFQTS